MKPYSEACERNKEPILEVLRQWFVAPGAVLEIGAGTGQHAAHFAQHMPHLDWISTDREENHAGIRLWVEAADLPNLRGPVQLNVTDALWPVASASYAFSANTAHIMGWPEVESMFAGVARVLAPGGVFCLYGPFNRDGRFTSESNFAFDQMLRKRDAAMGIRDDQAMLELGRRNELKLAADQSLPANNRVLVFVRNPVVR
jgi:SAM-dependent methyltransferase